ncbi:putative disease resistance RPP13-like protein 1 [Mangifera indica]|uniref:putative disease resistance RPP13-like protein 1 n=1 Tax=Mangifera indica TaxID=29780 RepID=UPI001CFACDAD|nr:putative disease resistance RPP13-like protein 1 [Mangifera indica]XP_044465074.1 putative disease resistance RPP13-like protein 1 [Mangifera indica]
MAVELLLSAALPVLFQKLASSEFYNFLFEEGVRSKLANWERKLEKIDAVLSSAEEKQLMSRPVKLWLEDLQHLAYDVEDILEEFAYEASRHSSTPSCFKNFTPRAIKFDYSMQSRIEDITSRFEELYRERAELGLIHESSGGASSAAASAAQQRPSSSSLPTGKAFHGRGDAKEKILEMVSRDANFSVIAIVGMGGIGKTTLACEVYNDKKLEDFKFEKKMWVSISEDFDVFRISKSLLESINKNSGKLSTLDAVQKQLKEEVRGRKFFLVLDDVWNENLSSWETLKSPFIEGAPGSKIIVTTRSKKIAQIMGSSEPYELGQLSDEDCWQLFMEYAFEGKTPRAPEVSDSLRKKIVGKSSGLPLAAKTLGSLLRSMEIEKWENVLNSKIWDSADVGGILPVLKLSYYHLPPHLKRCFSYCAIFPKDYEFEEMELGLLWLAEGLIQPLNQHLDLAGEYFRDLCSRSLFQKSTSYNSKYIMHDLVHDLAQSISGEVCFRLDEGANTKSPKTFEKTRRLSYTAKGCSGKDFLKDLEKFKRLRTFFPVFKNSYSKHFLCAMVLFDVLPQLKKLRVLSLERYQITYLPDSIGDLMHLRYLNFSSSRIKILPESISQLLNLQTLILKDCSYLKKLPSKMRCLTNLYHLDISGTDSLEEMPSRMKELKNLRMLSNFIVGKELSSNLEDLKSLNFLKGELHILKLENANNVKQLGGLILNSKKDLKVLILEWKSPFDDLREEEKEKNVLDMLKPHSNLQELTIRYYGGLEFPSWLSTLSSLFKLTVLRLENCEKCTSLPSLSPLSSLKELQIEGMPKLERIDMQSSDNSLEIIYLENLQNCQCLDTKGENENGGRFPNLHKLSIIDCPKLTVELSDHLPSLKVLYIEKCAKWMVSFSSFPKLTKLRVFNCLSHLQHLEDISSTSLESLWITKCKVLTCLSLPMTLKDLLIGSCEDLTTLSIHGKLECLQIWNCQKLKSIEVAIHNSPSLKTIGLDGLQNLESFSIQNLTSLLDLTIRNSSVSLRIEDFPTSMSNLNIMGSVEMSKALINWGLHKFTSLKSLSINGFEDLQLSLQEDQQTPLPLESLAISNLASFRSISDLDKLTSLKSLDILLSNLNSIPDLGGDSSLEKLSITNCTELESVACLRNLTSLQTLVILNCPKLKSLPKPPPSLLELEIENSFLEELSITNCTGLKSVACLRNRTSLQTLVISNCPKLKSLPKPPPSLLELEIENSSLEKLRITKCTELKSVAYLRNLTSLQTLMISKCPKLKSLPKPPSSLPELEIENSSLEELRITECRELKSVACLRNLTSLQTLVISNCPKLKSLPKLPPSLLELEIKECSSLQKHWRRGKGKYCSKIAHIPRVEIDRKLIFNSKEEEIELN